MKWNAYNKAAAEETAANTRERDAKANLLDERRRLVAAQVEKAEVQNEAMRRVRLMAQAPRVNPCKGVFMRGLIRGFLIGGGLVTLYSILSM